jgi:hypothetical protein
MFGAGFLPLLSRPFVAGIDGRGLTQRAGAGGDGSGRAVHSLNDSRQLHIRKDAPYRFAKALFGIGSTGPPGADGNEDLAVNAAGC